MKNFLPSNATERYLFVFNKKSKLAEVSIDEDFLECFECREGMAKAVCTTPITKQCPQYFQLRIEQNYQTTDDQQN